MQDPEIKMKKEEIITLLMMGARESIINEDPSSTIEGIFGDLN